MEKIKNKILKELEIPLEDSEYYWLFTLNGKNGTPISHFVMPKASTMGDLKTALCNQFRSDLSGLDIALEDGSKLIKLFVDQLPPTQTFMHTNIKEPIYVNILPSSV